MRDYPPGRGNLPRSHAWAKAVSIELGGRVSYLACCAVCSWRLCVGVHPLPEVWPRRPWRRVPQFAASCDKSVSSVPDLALCIVTIISALGSYRVSPSVRFLTTARCVGPRYAMSMGSLRRRCEDSPLARARSHAWFCTHRPIDARVNPVSSFRLQCRRVPCPLQTARAIVGWRTQMSRPMLGAAVNAIVEVDASRHSAAVAAVATAGAPLWPRPFDGFGHRGFAAQPCGQPPQTAPMDEGGAGHRRRRCRPRASALCAALSFSSGKAIPS